MKKIICFFTLLALSLSSSTIKADKYLKFDFSSGNFYIDVLGIFATYGINKKMGYFLIDNYFTMSALSVDTDPYANNTIISNNSDNFLKPLYGFSFPSILNGLGTGVKWGYRKPYEMFLQQWAIYGSLHATYNYYLLDVGNEKLGNSILKLSPGIGGHVALGKENSNVSCILDVNLRYDIPVINVGDFGNGLGCLNTGFSPRISIIVAGPKLRDLGMNVGVFYEWNTYNVFKPSNYFIEPYKVKGSTFGINFTMYPW